MTDSQQPPHLFADDELQDNDEDLFATPLDSKPPSEIRGDPLRDSDIFDEANDEVSLSSPGKTCRSTVDNEPLGVTCDPLQAVSSEPLGVYSDSVEVTDESQGVATSSRTKPNIVQKAASTDTAPSSVKLSAALHSLKQSESLAEDSEDNDSKYDITISVVSPRKVGDGVGAYMVYKIMTKTNIPDFRHSEMEVCRRFSDFLGLHEKLVLKHLHDGRIIPPPPQKSVIGMTKVKISSEEASSSEFIERRRASLERFINRVAVHPTLQTDPAFVDFLEVEGDLPRATSTSALSSAGVMRLFKGVGDSIGKMAFKVDETDQWFEEKTLQLETLDTQLKKLYCSVETLVLHRRELAQNAGGFARSVAALGTAEEHTALSRALSQLSEVEEKVESVHTAQAEADFYVLSELVHDYVGMLQAVKEAMCERVKLYRVWKDDELMLTKKRETKVRQELAHKTDKINEASREITECERKVERSQEQFEIISRQLRRELELFDRQRCRDFSASFVVYLESLLNTQQQLIKHWQLFLPEAKAVI